MKRNNEQDLPSDALGLLIDDDPGAGTARSADLDGCLDLGTAQAHDSLSDTVGSEKTPEAISQALLREFEVAREDKSTAELAYAECRRELLRLHHAGAPVEPGTLDLTVEEKEWRQLTKDAVTAKFGPEFFESLLWQIQPSIREFVKVHPAEHTQ